MVKENNNTISKKEQRTRLLEIISVFRKYDVLLNFVRQRNPHKVKIAFEELGVTFIKIGQMLSTRSDLVSPEFIEEFRQLQDNVTEDPFPVVEKIIKKQTGRSVSELFKHFTEKPFASASIGQTHLAELKDGTRVAVKVQHKNVREIVETDLVLFEQALTILKFAPDSSVIDIRKTLFEIKRALLDEIDTMTEAKNGSEFYKLNNGQGIIQVPRFYPDLSVQGMLVSEYMPGKSIRERLPKPQEEASEQILQQQKEERHFLAQALIQNFIKQVFTDHFFHADPHPGNILFTRLKDTKGQAAAEPKFSHQFGKTRVAVGKIKALPPYRLTYLDFGMMGHLSASLADGIANVIIAINTKDIREIGQALLIICDRAGVVDEEEFYAQLGLFLTPYLQSGLGEIDFPTLLFRIIQLCRDNNLRIKSEVTLLVKAFGLIEGLVVQLEPDISMVDVARPFAREYLWRKFNVQNEIENSVFNFWRAFTATPQIPVKIGKFLDVLTQGRAQLKFSYKNQESLLQRVEGMINKLVTAIILAATIVGSSLLVQAGAGNSFVYNLGVGGYILTVSVVILMIVNTLYKRYKAWRKRRRERK
ncbi:ABC1 kinase family protein [Liquorilactobacillus capillatus]|nr:AarF/UbiB family protein [Liquorilactobacillus capillatus]